MRSLQTSNELMDGLRRGDPHALRDLHKLFYGPLCLFAEKMTSDRFTAEDIVGESFVKFWQKRTDFETLSNIKAFLYITTKNASLNVLKRVRRENLSQKQLAYVSSDREEFVLNDIVRSEVLREIMQEIERLPEQCGKVLKMAYLEGMKNQEIADKMEISVHTVKNQKARAVQLLKIKLRDRDLMAFFILCTYFSE